MYVHMYLLLCTYSLNPDVCASVFVFAGACVRVCECAFVCMSVVRGERECVCTFMCVYVCMNVCL